MPRRKLDPELLNAFTEGFYGYGNYKSDIWFVGVEEGGAGSYEKIVKHLQCWKERGGCELEDLRKFHEQKRVTKWFEHKPREHKPPLQRTWKGLLRILLSSRGTSPATDELRQAQIELLGRADRHNSLDNCLLELLPLPAPGARKWPYADLIDESDLENHLSERPRYKQWAREFRVQHLRDAVHIHRPKVVLFYGRGRFYLDCWKSIAGVSFHNEDKKTLVARDAHTQFVITPHMVARNVTNSYLDHVGRLIGSKLSTSHLHR